MISPGTFAIGGYGGTDWGAQGPETGYRIAQLQGQNQTFLQRLQSDAAMKQLQAQLGGAQALENSRHGAAMSMAKQQEVWKRGRFNQIFPFIKEQTQWARDSFGNLNSGSGGGGTGSFTLPPIGPMPSTPAPTINAGPVFDPQMIQQQVNAGWNTADKRAATQTQRSQNEFAGRGFSSRSPVMSAMAGQFQNQALATGTENARNTRLGAAQANASNILEGQKAQSQQHAQGQQNLIDWTKIQSGQNIAEAQVNSELQRARLDAQARMMSSLFGSNYFGGYLS